MCAGVSSGSVEVDGWDKCFDATAQPRAVQWGFGGLDLNFVWARQGHGK